jgi:membrane protein YdbS with pleckstrin-like domain
MARRMSILIFALILILIVGLAIYAVDLVPMDPRLRIAAKLLIVVIAILLLCDRAGLI